MDQATIKHQQVWESNDDQDQDQEDTFEDDLMEEDESQSYLMEDNNSNGGGGGGVGGGGLLDLDTSTWNEEELAAYQALKSKRKKCAVSGCTSRSIPIAKSYHQLPVRNAEVWQQWVEAIRWSKNDPEWLPQQDQPLVCSRHFDDSSFIKYEGSSRMRLTHTAIPTLYIDPPNGTEHMNPKFDDPNRSLPEFVPNLKIRERPSQAKNGGANSFNGAGGNGQKKFVRNGVTTATASRVKPESKELLEVTPELPTLDEYSDDYYNNDNGGYYQEEGDGSSEDMHYDESSDYKNMQMPLYHQKQEAPGGYEDDEEDDGTYDDDMSSYLQPEVVMQQQNQSYSSMAVQSSSKRSMPTLKPCPRAPKLEPAVRKVPAATATAASASSQLRMQMPVQQQRLIMTQKRPQAQAAAAGPSSQIKRSLPVSSTITSTMMANRRPTNNMNIVSTSPAVAQRRTMLKMKVTNPGNGMSSGGRGGSQKLKIGVTKCRMIVERIEQYLEESIRQVSQEMDVPVQVVRGIWQVKDRIKQGNHINHIQS